MVLAHLTAMDIYDRLRRDHDRQRDLCARVSETSGDSKARRELWNQLRIEAEAHADAEEQVFYATLMKKPKAQQEARHSVAEHETLSSIARELDEMDMSSPAWLNRFSTFADKLVHHIEEEEREVFPLSRQVMDANRADALADDFADRKREQVAEHA